MEQEHEPVVSRQLGLQQGVWARARFSCPGACPRVCAEARGQAGLGGRLPTGGVCAGPGELVRLGQDVAGGGEERALLALPQGEAPGVQIWKAPGLRVVPGRCPQRHAGLAASLPAEPGGQRPQHWSPLGQRGLAAGWRCWGLAVTRGHSPSERGTGGAGLSRRWAVTGGGTAAGTDGVSWHRSPWGQRCHPARGCHGDARGWGRLCPC